MNILRWFAGIWLLGVVAYLAWYLLNFSVGPGVLFVLTVATLAGFLPPWNLPTIGPKIKGVPIERLFIYLILLPFLFFGAYPLRGTPGGNFLLIAIPIGIILLFITEIKRPKTLLASTKAGTKSVL
jgi:hypothetical protein